MKIKYNTETLQHIITDLSELAGLSIAFIDNNFNYLVRAYDDEDYCSKLQKLNLLEKPCFCSDNDILNKCKKSGKLESHICHAGLCDSAMPIIKNGIITGYIIFGRIRTKNSPKSNKFVSDINNKPVLDALYQKLPYFTEKQINCLSDLLPRILFQNAIEIENDSFITEITDYIEQNLNNELTVELLCSKFFISKNRLYDAFHSHFNSTVNEYITNRRIAKAKELLKNTKEPIYKIAEDVGIENYTYFCKLFKRKTGLTPTEYRTAPQN